MDKGADIMSQKEQRIKTGILVLIIIAFLASTFLILANVANLWERWIFREEYIPTLNLVTEKSEWKYMDTGKEPGVGNVLTTLKYDAVEWENQKGVFQRTLTEDSLSSTAFFRYEFNIANIERYNHMEGTIHYADAAIIYLNGNIIYAGNIPSGGYYSNQEMGASNELEGVKEDNFEITDLSKLKEGKNILAVEVHRKDQKSKNMHFYFPNLYLSKMKKEEIKPDTEGMMLLVGDKEDEVKVSWLTDSDRPYKIEYMEGKQGDVRADTFSYYAKSVIMGSKKIGDGIYENTATISRLKAETDYVYRVIQIGNKMSSNIYQFHTAKKQEEIFAIAGIIDTGFVFQGEELESWKQRIKRAIELSGRVDFLILNKGNILASIIDEIGFRTPAELKEIPIIIAEHSTSQKHMEGEDIQNRYWAYSDMILIDLDTSNKEYEKDKEFMKSVIKEKNRNWVIVMTNMSHIYNNHRVRQEYERIFSELNVDIVLDTNKAYSKFFLEEKKLEIGGVIDKRVGEVVYITESLFWKNIKQRISEGNETKSKYEEIEPSIIKIKSSNQRLTVEAYRIEDGQKIDSFYIKKSNE